MLKMQKWRFFRRTYLFFILTMLFGCTDHKQTIPFEFPEYKPRLVILSSIGTISGGEAFVSWSKPLRGQNGVVPVLPTLSVFLLEDGLHIREFKAVEDSLGYFKIDPEEFTARLGAGYAIEIWIQEKGERIFSDLCYLPEKPILEDVKVDVDAYVPSIFKVSWSQKESGGGVGATVLYPFLFNKDGEIEGKQGLGAYYISPEFRNTDGNPLEGRKGTKRFDRLLKDEEGTAELAKGADVRLAFLSPELAQFKKEMDELGYLGESIFQTVRPLYSNISGAEGIFGLYNESSVKVSF